VKTKAGTNLLLQLLFDLKLGNSDIHCVCGWEVGRVRAVWHWLHWPMMWRLLGRCELLLMPMTKWVVGSAAEEAGQLTTAAKSVASIQQLITDIVIRCRLRKAGP
jgi:hypothetical protein